MSDGDLCIPNISASGRRRRRNVAVVLLGVAGVAWLASMGLHASPGVRALVGLPIAGAVTSYLQVRRSTCIAHARTGRIEHDDFSTTAAPTEQSEASRRVAATIVRDGLLSGLAAALVAAASSLAWA